MHLTRQALSGNNLPQVLPEHIQAELTAAIAIAASSLSPGSPESSHSSASKAPLNVAPAPRKDGVRWAIDASEKARFDAVFKQSDPTSSGYISGDRAYQIFIQSGLPKNILAQIWKLSDSHNHGKLNPDEFAVAMYLIHKKLAGYDLPTTLPPELVPPSTRDLASATALMKNQVINDVVINKTGISPHGSFSNLTSDPLIQSQLQPTRSKIDSDADAKAAAEAKKKELSEELRKKRDECHSVQSQVNASRVIAEDLEKSIAKYRQEIADAHDLIVEALNLNQVLVNREAPRLHLDSNNQRDRLKLEATRIESEIQATSRDIRALEGAILDNKTAVSQKRGSQKSAPAAVPGLDLTALLGAAGQSDAMSQLLAQRMKALGVSSGETSATDVLKFKEERLTREKEIDQIEEATRALMDNICRALVPSLAQSSKAQFKSSWEPHINDKLKYEDGIGLRSNIAREIAQDLKRRTPVVTVAPPKLLADPVVSARPIDNPYRPTEPAPAPVSFAATRTATAGAFSSAAQQSASTTTDLFGSSKESVPGIGQASSFSTASYFNSPFSSKRPEPTPAELPGSVPATPAPVQEPRIPPNEPPPKPDPSVGSSAAISASAPAQSTNPFAAFATSTSISRADEPRIGDFAYEPVGEKPREAPSTSSLERPSPFEIFRQRDAESKATERKSERSTSPAKRPPSPPKPSFLNAREPSPSSHTSETLPEIQKSSFSVKQFATSLSAQQSGSQSDGATSTPPRAAPPLPAMASSIGSVKQMASSFNPFGPAPKETASASASLSPASEANNPFGSSRPATSEASRAVGGSVDRVADASHKGSFQAALRAIQNSKTEVSNDDNSAPAGGFAPVSMPSHAVSPSTAFAPPPPPPPPPPAIASVATHEFAPPPPPPVSVPSGPPPPGASNGSVPPPPPPPPPPGGAPVKNWRAEREATVSAAGASEQPKRKPTPASVGAVGPSLFGLRDGSAAAAASVGKVSSKIKDLQSNMSGIFGGSALPTTSSAPLESSVKPSAPAPEQQVSASALNPPQSLSATSAERALVGQGDIAGDTNEPKPSYTLAPVHAPAQTDISGGWEILDKHETVPMEDAQSSPVVVIEPETTLYQVKCLFKFEAIRADDLSMAPDDIIDVRREQGDWLFGCDSNGNQGWIPRNYAERFDSASPVEAAQTSERSFICHAEALYEFHPSRDDEVALAVGEIVGVLQKVDADWWKIQKASGDSGLVPAAYVQELGADDNRQLGLGAPGPDNADSQGSFGRDQFEDSPSSGFGSANPFGSAGATEGFPQHGLPSSVSYGNLELSRSVSFASNPSDARDINITSGSFYGDSHLSPDALGASLSRSPSMMQYSSSQHQGLSSSWSNAVDASILSSLSAEEKKRQDAIHELIATEQSYVRDLQIIVDVFYGPMTGMLLESDFRTIFSNIEDLLISNTMILSDFETLLKEGNGYIGAIGDTFSRHASSLEAYTVYCGNQMGASKLLQKRCQESQPLTQFVKTAQQNPACRSLDLHAFLLKPMQRITRYPLLLRQILHYTPKTHPDHQNVLQALELAEAAAERVNIAAKDRENRVAIEKIVASLDFDDSPPEYRIDLFSSTRSLGKRQFIQEGPLAKAKSGRKLRGFIFNDLFLLAQPHSKKGAHSKPLSLYRKPYLLHEISVRSVPGGDDTLFDIIQGADVLSLRAPSASEKRGWVSAIETQIKIIKDTDKRGQNTPQTVNTPANAPIGTLEVIVISGKSLLVEGGVPFGVYCHVQLNNQKLKTNLSKDAVAPKWNCTQLFSLTSFDDTLRITVYNYNKFSRDDFLGHAEVQLDMLEYYIGKETEVMTLPLAHVPSGSVSIKMAYKTA
ncbi:uncharacterized protein BJ171DRAFT_528088 [Polychytrium aggregatum]|uniref:uncharacterized protein n=1 Tax=Polychytrium aggregatum TaxID=110093 RepID=UPI0022FDB464|nr:uncharacterized protein BJ171DRAFT_528088 [Polychytrium aggregatum]KAI9193369.1 hypothetical protein BJ171DRAFT_528088 [Polychytrium aggregatum]